MRTPILTPEKIPGIVQQAEQGMAGANAIGQGLGSVQRGLNEVAAFAEERQKANGEIWAARHLAEARAHWAQMVAEREDAAEGDAAGYARDFGASFDEYTASILDRAPNEHARKRLELSLINMGGQLGARAFTFEATKRVAYREDMIAGTIDMEVNSVLSNASLFNDAIANVDTLIANAGIPGDKRREIGKEARRKLAVAQVHAMLRDNPTEAMNGLDAGRWDRYLTPEDKNRLLNASRPAAGRAIGRAAFESAGRALAAAYKSGKVGDIAAAVMPALVMRESAGDAGAVSPKGAMGLAQLMPDTAVYVAKKLGIKMDRAALLAKIKDGTEEGNALNLKLGQAYLEEQLEKYGGNVTLALAAYNAGPERVDEWIERFGNPNDGIVSNADWAARIPFKETREYVGAIMESLGRGGAALKIKGIPDATVRAAAEAEVGRAEAEKEAEARKFLVGFDDEMKYLAGGGEPVDSPYTRESLMEKLGPVRGQAAWDARQKAFVTGQVFNSLKMAAPEETVKLREGLVEATKDPIDYAAAKERLALFDRLAAAKSKALAEDPAGYVASVANINPKMFESNPALYADMVLRAQAKLGVGRNNARVLTDAQAKAMVADLAGTPSELVGAKLNGLHETWADSWPIILASLKEAKLPAGDYVAAIYADDAVLSQQIIEATRAGKELETGLDSEAVNNLKNSLASEMTPYMEAFGAGTIPGAEAAEFDQLYSTMETWMIAQFRAGNANAASDAVDRFMGSKFLDPMDTGRVHALIPKEWNGKELTEEKVNMLTDGMMEEEIIRFFKPTIIGPAGPGAMDSTISAAINSGVWVTNRERTGLVLMVPDKRGFMGPLKNEKGLTYQVPFSAIADTAEPGDAEVTIDALMEVNRALFGER